MEDKHQTSIEELINEAIPNSFGVSIDIKLMEQLWDKKGEYDKFNKYIYNFMMNKINNFNIDNMLVYCNFIIQSLNSKKCIKLSEETIINMFLQYFNAPYHLKIEPIYSLEEKQERITEEIKKLKNIIKEQIKKIETTKNLDEIKTIMPALYGNYIYLYEKYYNEVKHYVKTEKDDLSLKIRWNEIFEKLKSTDISNFRKLSLWLEDLIKELSSPIEFYYFKNINIQKLKLFIAKQYFEYSKISDEKSSLLLMDFIKRTIKEQKDLKIVIKDINFVTPKREKNYYEYYEQYNNDMLEKEFNEYLEKTPELKSKLEKLTDYNKEDFSNLNYNEVLKYVDMILEDDEIKKEIEIVEEKELTNELLTINEELENINLSTETKNKLNSQKNKLEFLLKECKPHKLCKGIKTFEGYYGYIYPNGIIVFDKLDKDANKSYGHAIYIMPIEKIKDYSSFSLPELRKMIKENIIRDADYKYHSGNWKEEIKKIIDKTQYKEKESKYDYEEVELPFDLKELDKITERLSQIEETKSTNILKNKIEKQKEEIIKKSKEIDETIKNNNSTSEINNKEREELKQEEEELSSSDYKTFIELFESWLKNNTKEKVKRNSAVSLYTKLRSRDEDGNFRCELCNCAGFSLTDFESHHFIPLSKNGPDNIYNTVCLCPNCHTNIHNNKITYNQKYNLLMKIKQNIEKYNSEYIEQFNYYFDEILNIYKKTLDSITNIEEEKEYYKKNKEQIEELFKIYYIGNQEETIKHNK